MTDDDRAVLAWVAGLRHVEETLIRVGPISPAGLLAELPRFAPAQVADALWTLRAAHRLRLAGHDEHGVSLLAVVEGGR